jgi:hypothetical protein
MLPKMLPNLIFNLLTLWFHVGCEEPTVFAFIQKSWCRIENADSGIALQRTKTPRYHSTGGGGSATSQSLGFGAIRSCARGIRAYQRRPWPARNLNLFGATDQEPHFNGVLPYSLFPISPCRRVAPSVAEHFLEWPRCIAVPGDRCEKLL